MSQMTFIISVQKSNYPGVIICLRNLWVQLPYYKLWRGKKVAISVFVIDLKLFSFFSMQMTLIWSKYFEAKVSPRFISVLSAGIFKTKTQNISINIHGMGEYIREIRLLRRQCPL